MSCDNDIRFYLHHYENLQFSDIYCGFISNFE